MVTFTLFTINTQQNGFYCVYSVLIMRQLREKIGVSQARVVSIGRQLDAC
jgi:hypothetical protein